MDVTKWHQTIVIKIESNVTYIPKIKSSDTMEHTTEHTTEHTQCSRKWIRFCRKTYAVITQIENATFHFNLEFICLYKKASDFLKCGIWRKERVEPCQIGKIWKLAEIDFLMFLRVLKWIFTEKNFCRKEFSQGRIFAGKDFY